jgi:SAM-dependent methyltransferase
MPAGLSLANEYDAFAWLYANRWGAEYHEQGYAVLQRLLLHQLPDGASILDIGCGDGRLTRTMALAGFRVLGIDSSGAMLEYARERCPEARFEQADARSFEVTEHFDVAVSTFDALNHVMSPDDLAGVFRCVERALKPGGFFAFDVNREEAYTDLWPSTSAIVEPERVSVTVGRYRPDLRIASGEFTVFRLVDRQWQRSDFRMTQYCHRERDIIESLYAARFADVEHFDASADLGMSGNIGKGRTYYLGRKAIQ